MFNNDVYVNTLLGLRMGLSERVKCILTMGLGRATKSSGELSEQLSKPSAAPQNSTLDRVNNSFECGNQATAIDPALAEAHFNQGVLYLESDNPELALGAFSLALLAKPQSAGTHYNIGNAHLALGNFAEAVASYTTAISFKPSFTDAELALQAAYYQRDTYAEQLFQQAVSLQEQRRFNESEAVYRTVLALTPDRAEVCSNLGGILLHNERLDEALLYFQRATHLSPEAADIHANLGNAYRFLNQLENSKSSYERSALLDAGKSATWLQLGNVQRELGLHRDALISYARSIDIDASLSEAHLNMCVAFIALEDYESAEVYCSKAIELDPDNPVALSNLGVVMRRRGKFSEALNCFERAIALEPDFSEAHLNSGTVYMALGQFATALQAYQSALAINPKSAEALSNCGAVLLRLERTTEAEKCLLSALALNANLVTALNNLGLVFSTTRRMGEAVKYFERAIANKPDYVDAYANLGGVLKDLGRLEESLSILRRAIAIDPNCLIAHSNLLLIGSYASNQPNELLLSAARHYGDVVARLATPYSAWKSKPLPERNLRIGLVSGDLCSHPVGYFLDGILSCLTSTDTTTLEIFAYSCRQVGEDVMSEKLRKYCTSWQSVVGLSDQEFATQIHDHDQIDILIDLAGHTANNRLAVFAWRPAPVQLTWLGYFATTGVTAVDYILADPCTLPLEQEVNFTERVWRLPETRLCFTSPDVTLEVNRLPALSQGFITFGCFNNLSKVNDAVIRVWAEILAAVPFSRLFLKYQQLGDISLRQHTLSRFAAHGIKPERLILEDYGPRSEYLAAYHRVDISLDPFPFPGGTTTAESLWMGVPVLTLSGESFLSRQGVGLLVNAGLSDWVAENVQDYVDRAVLHAGRVGILSDLRGRLRHQVLESPIFDAARFANHLQTALRSMWHIWCRSI